MRQLSIKSISQTINDDIAELKEAKVSDISFDQSTIKTMGDFFKHKNEEAIEEII